MLNRARDTASIAMAVNDLQVAVIKATRRAETPPKQKHVSRLLSSTFHPETSLFDLFRVLQKRLYSSDWIVVYKGLELLHILLQRGHTESVYTHVCSRKGLFTFQPTAIKNGGSQIKNIKHYVEYLEERSIIYSEIGYDFCLLSAEQAEIKEESISDLLKKSEIAMREIKALLKCTFFTDELNNVVTRHACALLLVDLCKLYSVTNKFMIQVLNDFLQMDKRDAENSIRILREFFSISLDSDDYFKMASRAGLSVPDLVPFDIALVETLEEYLVNRTKEGVQSVKDLVLQPFEQPFAQTNPFADDLFDEDYFSEPLVQFDDEPEQQMLSLDNSPFNEEPQHSLVPFGLNQAADRSVNMNYDLSTEIPRSQPQRPRSTNSTNPFAQHAKQGYQFAEFDPFA